MEDEFEQQEWFKFGMAATLMKQFASDQRAFLELLAQMLEGALPDETSIEKTGAFFSKKTVKKIVINLGDNRYTIDDTGHGSLQSFKTHIVRGIALKTEPIPVQDWLAELGSALDEKARASAAASKALSRLLS